MNALPRQRAAGRKEDLKGGKAVRLAASKDVAARIKDICCGSVAGHHLTEVVLVVSSGVCWTAGSWARLGLPPASSEDY